MDRIINKQGLSNNVPEGKGENQIVVIKKTHLAFLINLSLQTKPLETCAILIGKRNNNQFSILEVMPMDNDDKSEVSFAINEDKLFAVYKHTESVNLAVVGVYHTHPSVPMPSKTDIKYMEINPIPWIIHSTTINKTKCFIHDEIDGIKEIELIVKD
ncbi:MAG TPA: M67 family metallopeptidase [Candidatus Nitrosocosmicus sp.]|nr:M67 family metallopeptidase [Candidatus Nitrosocosmicus sp.]